MWQLKHQPPCRPTGPLRCASRHRCPAHRHGPPPWHHPRRRRRQHPSTARPSTRPTHPRPAPQSPKHCPRYSPAPPSPPSWWPRFSRARYHPHHRSARQMRRQQPALQSRRSPAGRSRRCPPQRSQHRPQPPPQRPKAHRHHRPPPSPPGAFLQAWRVMHRNRPRSPVSSGRQQGGRPRPPRRKRRMAGRRSAPRRPLRARSNPSTAMRRVWPGWRGTTSRQRHHPACSPSATWMAPRPTGTGRWKRGCAVLPPSTPRRRPQPCQPTDRRLRPCRCGPMHKPRCPRKTPPHRQGQGHPRTWPACGATPHRRHQRRRRRSPPQAAPGRQHRLLRPPRPPPPLRMRGFGREAPPHPERRRRRSPYPPARRDRRRLPRLHRKPCPRRTAANSPASGTASRHRRPPPLPRDPSRLKAPHGHRHHRATWPSNRCRKPGFALHRRRPHRQHPQPHRPQRHRAVTAFRLCPDQGGPCRGSRHRLHSGQTHRRPVPGRGQPQPHRQVVNRHRDNRHSRRRAPVMPARRLRPRRRRRRSSHGPIRPPPAPSRNRPFGRPVRARICHHRRPRHRPPVQLGTPCRSPAGRDRPHRIQACKRCGRAALHRSCRPHPQPPRQRRQRPPNRP